MPVTKKKKDRVTKNNIIYVYKTVTKLKHHE